MADNVGYTAGSGVNIASDERTINSVTVQIQRISEIGASAFSTGQTTVSNAGTAVAAAVETRKRIVLVNQETVPVLDRLVANFAAHLSPELRECFSSQGLSVYEAVILASIVEREAVRDEEAALIAAVYLNRLRAGMRLDADPTVQYALGYDASAQTSWWTNPLSLDDLQVDSPFNTYRVGALPPTPIANPGARALQAVAPPATPSHYYFSARCDESGYHNFARAFEEHVANLCP